MDKLSKELFAVQKQEDRVLKVLYSCSRFKWLNPSSKKSKKKNPILLQAQEQGLNCCSTKMRYPERLITLIRQMHFFCRKNVETEIALSHFLQECNCNSHKQQNTKHRYAIATVLISTPTDISTFRVLLCQIILLMMK